MPGGRPITGSSGCLLSSDRSGARRYPAVVGSIEGHTNRCRLAEGRQFHGGLATSGPRQDGVRIAHCARLGRHEGPVASSRCIGDVLGDQFATVDVPSRADAFEPESVVTMRPVDLQMHRPARAPLRTCLVRIFCALRFGRSVADVGKQIPATGQHDGAPYGKRDHAKRDHVEGIADRPYRLPCKRLADPATILPPCPSGS